MQQALTVIGYPMVQVKYTRIFIINLFSYTYIIYLKVGVSTIVALLPLLFKQSYLAMVFLKVSFLYYKNIHINFKSPTYFYKFQLIFQKTIIVVVSLGMFHGLVLLPAILTALPLPKQKNKINKNSISGNSIFTINTKLDVVKENNENILSQKWRESRRSSKSNRS